MDATLLGWLVGASGVLLALITFWLNRGKAEAESFAEAKMAREEARSAQVMASTVSAQHTLMMKQLAEYQLEVANKFGAFSDKYASNQDLAQVEARVATALDGLRQEFRGLNDRFDRMFEHVLHGVAGTNITRK